MNNSFFAEAIHNPSEELNFSRSEHSVSPRANVVRTAAIVLLAALSSAGAKDITMPESAHASNQKQECFVDEGGALICTSTESSSETSTSNGVSPDVLTPEVPSTPQETSSPQPTTPDNPREPRQTKPKKLRFINYDQPDRSSCGPTAFAMAAATLKQNRRITPRHVARAMNAGSGIDYYRPGRGGTLRAVFTRKLDDYYNLRVKNTSWRGAKRTLKNGGLVLAHASPGHYTSYGHFVVLKKLNNGRFVMADPNGKGKHGDSEIAKGRTANKLRSQGIDKLWSVAKR